MAEAKNDAPRYVEAYPRFDVVRAEAAYIREEKVCSFLNESGHCLGILMVADNSDTSVTLEFIVAGPYIRHAFGAVTLPIEFAPNGVNKHHKFLRCPGCSGRKSVVVFKNDRWRCARCHGLRNRSQLVDRHTLKWERLEELRKLVGRGRPHGIHRSTYDRWMTELKELKRQLRGTYPAYPSKRHSYFIHAQWRSVAESRKDIGDFAGLKVCGDEVEVSRETWLGYRIFE